MLVIPDGPTSEAVPTMADRPFTKAVVEIRGVVSSCGVESAGFVIARVGAPESNVKVESEIKLMLWARSTARDRT